MKIQAKFWVEKYFLPTKKHRRLRLRYELESMDIEIPEPATADFPIAFIVTDYDWVYDGTDNEADFRKIDVEIRTYNGWLWKAVRYDDNVRKKSGWLPVESLKRSLNESSNKPYFMNDEAMYDPQCSIDINSNRVRRQQEILELSKEYVVFDSRVWQKTGEPCYHIQTFGLGCNHGGTSIFIDYIDDPKNKLHRFSALNRDKAIKYALDVANRRGDTKYIASIVNSEKNIKVLMPDMVRLYNDNWIKPGVRYCTECYNTEEFLAPALVKQMWVVDKCGKYISTDIDADDIIKYPSADDEWFCAVCGSETRIKK